MVVRLALPGLIWEIGYPWRLRTLPKPIYQTGLNKFHP
jgi:hypothetical protein